MTYFELEKPIALHEIDANERVSAAGHYSPFSKDGDVNQFYLTRIPSKFATYLRQTFAERWPSESPWGGQQVPPAHTPELIGSLTDLTLDLVKQSVEARKLQLDENILASAVSALRAGKHLILTGPPGTGKTELAFALCDAAAEADIAAGTLTTTATADWTSIETVGGYRLDSSRNLTFSPGVFVQAIDRKAWLVVDEFNRADIDKAIGQIFTVLSGQAITLPYSERKSGVEAPVSIVPAGEAKPVGTHEYRIDPRWRIIATLNSRDRDLLFNMSYALLRRFAIIDIPTPSKAVSLAILKIKAP